MGEGLTPTRRAAILIVQTHGVLQVVVRCTALSLEFLGQLAYLVRITIEREVSVEPSQRTAVGIKATQVR